MSHQTLVYGLDKTTVATAYPVLPPGGFLSVGREQEPLPGCVADRLGKPLTRERHFRDSDLINGVGSGSTK
jgi:hypothetical protein